MARETKSHQVHLRLEESNALIVESLDFSELLESIERSFSENLAHEKHQRIQPQLTKYLRFLADANLKCYHANMSIIAERKKSHPETTLISEMELRARVVGERRVHAKAAINALLTDMYHSTERQEPENWMTDDIVYSVGEMLDRLTIERIKIEDYQQNMTEKSKHDMGNKIQLSLKWSNRVCRYLDLKLQEISRKGSYESVEETRTYDLAGVVVSTATDSIHP